MNSATVLQMNCKVFNGWVAFMHGEAKDSPHCFVAAM